VWVVGGRGLQAGGVLGGQRPRRECRSGAAGRGGAGVLATLIRAQRHQPDRARWQAGSSQCHGLAGDAEFLLDLADALDPDHYRTWAGELAGCIYARHAIRGGRMVAPDETGTAIVPDYGTGLAGVLAFLLRLHHGGPRMWFPQALQAAHAGDPPAGRATLAVPTHIAAEPARGGDPHADRHQRPADLAGPGEDGPMKPLPTSHLRIARPSHDLRVSERFWVDGLGLDVLFRAGGVAEGGHALLMAGWPGAAWHLELVGDQAAAAAAVPTAEDLLVLYVGGAVDDGVIDRLIDAGGTRVTARNPYWERWGVTIADPDGYQLVLSTRSWP
jgi:hypothetical protein